MRDPKRIEKLLNLYKQIWELYPYTRFFQLEESLKYEFYETTKTGNEIISWEYDNHIQMLQLKGRDIDMYYVEDEKFITFLEWKLNKLKGDL